MDVVQRVNPASFHHKEKIVSVVSIWDDRQHSLNLCDNHFVRYVSQIIMMYTLNLHSDVCQLHLSKTGIKKKKQHLKFQSIVSPCGRVGGSLCLQVKGFWFHVAPGGTFNIPGCGVPTVAQKVTNPTSIHEDAGSIPGLTQWQESGVAVSCSVGHRRGSDPALLWLWHRVAAAALIQPLAWEVPLCHTCCPKKQKKEKETNKQTNKKPTNQPTNQPKNPSWTSFIWWSGVVPGDLQRSLQGSGFIVTGQHDVQVHIPLYAAAWFINIRENWWGDILLLFPQICFSPTLNLLCLEKRYG